MLGRRLVWAFGLAAFYGCLLYLAIWTGGPIMFISGLILLPMSLGSIFSAAFDPLVKSPIWVHLMWTAGLIFALLILSIVIFREGGICVAMAAPFFFAFSSLGSVLTRDLLRRQAKYTPPLMIVLPLLFLPVEGHLDMPVVEEAVVSVIEIDATPAEVWAHTVEIPAIAATELKPTFSHTVVGVPQPVDARMEGEGVGAVRQLAWTQGVWFQEVVTDWQQDRRLAWDFRFSQDSIPDRVEAHIDVNSRYLKISHGDYVLEPLENGGTRLTLTTHYRMATPINAYCRLWGKVFLGDFHKTVLKVIKARAEHA